jgi:tRNA(fMet)-specific endonuclease VapC
LTYLLDTNICIDHLRKRGSGALRRRLLVIPASEIAICSIVIAELLEGCYRSQQRDKNLRETRALISLFRSLPFDDAAAEHAAVIGAALKKPGQQIEQNDASIAAIALANNLIVVTHNASEFGRVPGLKHEDWQATP